ncbi:cobyric acid synthase [Marinilabiliaceae bacterium JC017]|nr:cobyric acid synthase [Marinilabiliaceae bacterium JC017]
MQQHRPIMFAGTGSDAGKSVINTGFCRILKQDGFNPAPFKAQNMSLNSYATPEGFEIGRAQATQAEACGIPCHTDMNPVLLKPTGETRSQVVLNGKPIGDRSAGEYFRSNNNQALFDEAFKAFERLRQRYSPLVMEGAGAISELNLKNRDIVNMPMALRTNAAVYLVADIDRGGVFASVYGSIALLEPEERALIKGIIINKFRGDITLFDDGKKIIEELTHIPVVGIIPYFNDIYIEDEDAVALDKKSNQAKEGLVNIGIVLLNQMANFTDFSTLEHDPRTHLYYSRDPQELEKADIIILPGSKNTLADLHFIRKTGIDTTILSARAKDKTVIGICGGYQMMGQTITDPKGIEGNLSTMEGLDLFPLQTTITEKKITKQVTFRFQNGNTLCKGYEIHMGCSTQTANVIPLNKKTDGTTEGIFMNKKCWGTYMHGILDNKEVIDTLLAPYTDKQSNDLNYLAFKEQQYDRLAAHLRQHLDIKAIYKEIRQTN